MDFIITIIITIIIIFITIIIIIIFVIVVVVVVVGDNTYYGTACSPTVHFKFITKHDKRYYRVRDRYYKLRQNKGSVLKKFIESDCGAAGRCPCGISSCVSWIPNNRQIEFRGNYNRNIEKLQTRAISPNRSTFCTTSYLLE